MNEVLKRCDFFLREKSSKFRLGLKKFNFLYVQQSKVWNLSRQNSLKKFGSQKRHITKEAFKMKSYAKPHILKILSNMKTYVEELHLPDKCLNFLEK